MSTAGGQQVLCYFGSEESLRSAQEVLALVVEIYWQHAQLTKPPGLMWGSAKSSEGKTYNFLASPENVAHAKEKLEKMSALIKPVLRISQFAERVG